MQQSSRGSGVDSNRFFLLLFIGTLVLGLGLAVFGNGGRYGLYTDDYPHKLRAFDIERQQWAPSLELAHPYLRPLGQVMVSNLGNLLPDREIPLRLWWASVHLANVLLASSLAYRLVRSPVVLVVTGGFLLFPVQAHEAIFWHSGAASALLGTLAPLVAMHLLLSAVSTEWRWKLYAVLGLLAYGLIPQFYEQGLALIVALPLFTLVDKPVSKKRVIRALILVALAVGLLALYWFFVLRHSHDASLRGGVQTAPEVILQERLPNVMVRIGWLMFGLHQPVGFAAALDLGTQNILGSPLSIILALLLVAGGAFVLMLASRQEKSPPSMRRILVLYGAGFVWIAMSFVSVIVIGNQFVEPRLLYLPWVGLAFVIAASVALVLTRLPRRWTYAVAVGLACLLAVQGLMMAGVGRAYQLRYEQDQRQLAALSQAIPRLPERPVFLVPIHTEEDYIAPVATGLGYSNLERTLLGVFEMDWSSASALKMLYRWRNLVVATHSHWTELDFGGIEKVGDGTHLLFKGRSWPTDMTLAFSYQDGQVVLHDSLIAELLDGSQVRLELPMARELGAPDADYEEAFIRQVSH